MCSSDLEIDRMVKEAEQYAEEDAKRRQAVEARNQGDQLVYTTEKFLGDNAEKLPEDVKTEVQADVDALKAILENADADAEEIQAAVTKLGDKAAWGPRIAQIQKANDEIAKGTKGPELMAKLTRSANPAQGDNIVKWVFGGENPPADAAAAAPQAQKPREDPTADQTVWKVTLSGSEPAKGKADALVTLVWYTDFQCPFCSRVQPTIEQLEKDYGDKLRIVFKNLPLDFHKNAMGAAEAALCAHEQGKFWEMEKHLYENQQQLEPGQLPDQAKSVGVDAAKWQKCMDSHQTKDAIAKDMATAEKVKATGTPAFFINGRSLEGAQPFEAFKQIIDEELASKKS